jgi:hypothetical protein
MDDFLYIIIGVIWVAYSLYSNKQKQDRKKAAREAQQGNAPQQAAPPPRRSFLEEILMGEMRPEAAPHEPEEDEYEPEFEPQQVMTSSEKIKTEAQSLETITEEVPANYFEHQYATRKDEAGNITEGKAVSMEEDENEEFSMENDRGFDLKTAVVYAEILNPRYI